MSSSTPSYKLVYFDIPGLAETSRILFRVAKVDFEDKRYPYRVDENKQTIRKEWEAEKSQYVYEKIPVLFTDGAEIAQSGAINRFVAKRLGFFGSNDIEGALIDAAIEQLQDVKREFFKVRDDATKAGLFFDNELAELFRFYSRQEEKLKPTPGHFIGNKLSLIDVLIWQLRENSGNPEKFNAVLSKFPTIKAIVDKVEQTEGVRVAKK